jgi:hypothetical protein
MSNSKLLLLANSSTHSLHFALFKEYLYLFFIVMHSVRNLDCEIWIDVRGF